jgi:hypothetical protein
MVERIIERRRLYQTPEQTDIIAASDVCRRVAESVPGSGCIKVTSWLPQVVAPADLFEDTIQILWQVLVRYAQKRKISFSLESVSAGNLCCFDFFCEEDSLQDLSVRRLFEVFVPPMRTEAVVEPGLGMALLNAELMGGHLEVLPTGGAARGPCLRLSLPGVSDPTYAGS